MAVQVPPEVNWLLDILCGQSWPEGDEDALRRCAQAWQEAAKGLGDLAGYLDSSAQKVLASADSMSADDYDNFWKTYIHDGDGTYVDLFKQCEPLVKQLFAQATEVEYTKIVIIVTLILTAIQIAIAIAAAAGTFGGSLAEVGLAMFIGRQTILMVVARFVEMALMMLIPDLVAQTVMFAQGHGWDWSKTGSAFENALAAGTIAAVLGPLAGKLPWMSEEAAQTIGGKIGALATHFVEGGAVNDLTALTTMGANYGLASLTGNKDWQQQIGQQWSSTNWVAQFAQGGVLADAFYFPHMFGHGGVPMTFTGSDGKSYTVYLNDAAFTSLRDTGQLPPDYQARVFGDNGVKVGDATFNGTAISFDKPINGHQAADLGDGFTVAGHDGSQFRFQPSDQTGSDGQPRFDLVSRVQRSADPITVRGADPGGDPLEFPPGSVVHYDNVPGQDGTMTGQPYRVEVTDGNVVKIYQAEQPGGPFELTGQVVHSNGVLRFFGADAPKYYGPEGQADGATALATVSLITGKTTTNDLPGYISAHVDRWGSGAPASPTGTAGPRVVDGTVVTPATDGQQAGQEQAGQEATPAAATGLVDASAFAYAQQVQQVQLMLQNHPELFADLAESMRGGAPRSPASEEADWPQLFSTGNHEIAVPSDLANLTETDVAARLAENRQAYESERQVLENQYRQDIKALEDTGTSSHTLRELDQARRARTGRYLLELKDMADRYQARDQEILSEKLTQMQRVRLARPEARINEALHSLDSEYKEQFDEIGKELDQELTVRRHMDLDRLYVPELERLDAEWARAEVLPGPERLQRFADLSRQLRDLEVGLYRQHEAIRIGPEASEARRWVRDMLSRALKDSKVNGTEQPDVARREVIARIDERVARLEQQAARTPAEKQAPLTAEAAELSKIAVELRGGSGQARPGPIGPVTRWPLARVEADPAVADAIDHVLASLPTERSGGSPRVYAVYEMVGFGVAEPGPIRINAGHAVPDEPSRWVDNAAGGVLNYLQMRAGVPGDLRVGSVADRRADAEFQIVAQVRARLAALRESKVNPIEPVGVVVIGADKLMCPSCQMALHELMGEFPGVQVVLASATVTVILDPALADMRPLSDVYGPTYTLHAEVVPLDASAAVDMGQVAGGAKFLEPAILRTDVPPELDLHAFARHPDGLADAAPGAPEYRDDYEMIIKIRQAVAERAQATGRTQAVVLDDTGEPHWVQGGRYGFASTPGKVMAWADGVHEADYPRPVVVDNPPDLRAALDTPADLAALSDLAAQMRARAAATGRVQAIVRDETGELRWVEGGRIGILSPPEPGLERGQLILLAGDPRLRIVAQTEWTDVNPTDIARQFPPGQFDERLVIPPTGDAIRLTSAARDDALGTEPASSGSGDAVSRSIADVLNQPPHPGSPPGGRPEVPSGFSRVDLPAGLDRLAGLVHKMPDRVAAHAGSDQKMIELVRQVPGVKGAFLVDVHGDVAGPWDPSSPQARLSVSEVRDLLVAAGWDGKQPVVLMSCDAGRSSYAADLAAELGVAVIAPTARVWQIGDRVFICEVNPATGLPDLSMPGHWEEFGGENPGAVAVDEHGMPALDAPHLDAEEADAQQQIIALRVLGDPLAHAPPVSRGEDDPFGRAGGDERAVWLDSDGRPLLPAVARVENPPWYHGPRTDFYAESGPEHPRNEIAIYALYDRQSHEFLKIGISDDPLSIRYRHGERAEDDRPVDVFVIGKFTGLPTGNTDRPWQTSRPAVEAVERYLIERWPGAISKDYLHLPTAASDRASMNPAELREMQDLLTRPERDWPTTPQAAAAFIDELSGKVRGYVSAAIAERITEISGQRTLSADDQARLAVLRVAQAQPLDELFTMREARIRLFDASYYDHPPKEAIRGRLYGEPPFAEPTLSQLRGASNRLTEQADLLEKVITQVPIHEPARAADATAGLARLRDLARQLQDAAAELTAKPSGAELHDLMAEATKIRDGILADARRPGQKAKDQVDAIFKPTVAGLELMPALRRSEPYELYLQWLVSRRPELAPVADLVQRLGSEQWADWANAAKCVHSALAYEMSRRLGQVAPPTELPADRVNGIASGRELAELASVWGPGTAFTELAPAQFKGAAGVLRGIFAGFGDGARGLVAIGYADGTGHVINVENVGGRVVFPDALDGTMDALYRLKGTAAGALPADAQQRADTRPYNPAITQVPVDYVAWLRTDDKNPNPQALAEFIGLPPGAGAHDIVTHDLPVPGRAEPGAFTNPAMARTMGQGGQNPAGAELPLVTNDPGQVGATGEVILVSAIEGTRPWVLEVGGHSDWLGPAVPVDVEPSDAAWPNVFSFDDAAVRLDLVRWPGRMDAVVVANAADIAERIDVLGAALRPGGLLVLDHGQTRALAGEGSPPSIWVRADAKDVPEGHERVYSGPDRIVLRKLGGGITGEQGRAEPDIGRLIATIAAKHEDAPSLFPSPLEIEARWGLTQHNQKLIQWIVDKEHALLLMRPGNAESAPMQESGGVTKPPALKANTIGEIDVILGARDLVGAVGFYRPDLGPAEAARAQLEQAGLWDAVQRRYMRRLEQYNELLPKIGHLILERKFRVVDGVIYPFDSVPILREGGIYDTLAVGEPELDTRGNLVAPVFAAGPDDTRLRPVNLWPSFNRALGVPVTGDYDMYHVLDATGEELPFDRPQVRTGEVAPSLWFKKLVDEGFMTQDQIRGKGADAGEMLARQMGIQHGAMLVFLRHNEITDWERENIYEPIIKGHQVGGTPLLLFQAGRRPTLVHPEPVPAELSRSPILDALNPPGGYHHWLAAVHGPDLLPAHLSVDPADVPADLTPLAPPTGLGDLAGLVFARADGNGVVISSDPEHLLAAAADAADDAFRLYAVGGGGQAWAPGGRNLSPGELFALAKEAGWDGSRPLELVVCEGGAGDEASLAAHVQAVARSEFPDAVVRGATDWVWQDPATGERIVAPGLWDPATGHFLPHPQRRGTWVRYPPDDHVVGQAGAQAGSTPTAHWVHWADSATPAVGSLPEVQHLLDVQEAALQGDLTRVTELESGLAGWMPVAQASAFVTALRDLAQAKRTELAGLLARLTDRPLLGANLGELAARAEETMQTLDRLGQQERLALQAPRGSHVDQVTAGLPADARAAIDRVTRIARYFAETDPAVTGVWRKPGLNSEYTLVTYDPKTENVSSRIHRLADELSANRRSAVWTRLTGRDQARIRAEIARQRAELADLKQMKKGLPAAGQFRSQDALSRIEAITARAKAYLAGNPPPAWPSGTDLAAIGKLADLNPIAQQLANVRQLVAHRTGFAQQLSALADALKATADPALSRAAARQASDRVALLTAVAQAWKITGPDEHPVPPESTVLTRVPVINPRTGWQVFDPVTGDAVTTLVSKVLDNVGSPATHRNPLEWAGIHAEPADQGDSLLLPGTPWKRYRIWRATADGIPPGLGGPMPTQTWDLTKYDVTLTLPNPADLGHPFENHYKVAVADNFATALERSWTQSLRASVTIPVPGPLELSGLPGTGANAIPFLGGQASVTSQPFALFNVFAPEGRLPWMRSSDDNYVNPGRLQVSVEKAGATVPDGLGSHWGVTTAGEEVLDTGSPGSRLRFMPVRVGEGVYPAITWNVTTTQVEAMIGFFEHLLSGHTAGALPPPSHPTIGPAPEPGTPLFSVGASLSFQIAATGTFSRRTEAGEPFFKLDESGKPMLSWDRSGSYELAIQLYPTIGTPSVLGPLQANVNFWPFLYETAIDLGPLAGLRDRIAAQLTSMFPWLGDGLHAKFADAINQAAGKLELTRNEALAEPERSALTHQQAAQRARQWLAGSQGPAGRPDRLSLDNVGRLHAAGYETAPVGRAGTQAVDRIINGERYVVIRPTGETAARVVENMADRFGTLARQAARRGTDVRGVVVDLSGTNVSAFDISRQVEAYLAGKAAEIGSTGGSLPHGRNRLPEAVILAPKDPAEPLHAAAVVGAAPIPAEIADLTGQLRQLGHRVISYSERGAAVVIVDDARYLVATPPSDATPAQAAATAAATAAGRTWPAGGLMIRVPPVMLTGMALDEFTRHLAVDLPDLPRAITLVTTSGTLHPLSHAELAAIHAGYADAQAQLVNLDGTDYVVAEPDLSASTGWSAGRDLAEHVLRCYTEAGTPPGQPPGGIIIDLHRTGLSTEDAMSALAKVAGQLPGSVVIIDADDNETWYLPNGSP